MSGTAYNPWAWLQRGVARRRAFKLAEAAGCNRTTTRETVACLKEVPALDITDLRRGFTNEKKDPLVYYGPVVDSAAAKPFLPKEPNELEPANIPWLTGITSGEGIIKTASYTLIPSFDWKEIDLNFTAYIESAVYNTYQPGSTKNLDDLRRFYFGNERLDDNSYQKMTDLFTDAAFFSPMMQGLERHPGPAYVYYFDYMGTYTLADFLGSRRIANGSCHTDEDIYLWEINAFLPPLEGDDLTFSRSLIKLWTNFAKYGFPTTKDSIINWERYDKEKKHLYMYNGGFSLQSDLLKERSVFWSNRRPM